MHCKNCGKQIDEKAEICVGCGVRVKEESKNNPTLAAVLSFIFVGLGQIYNGQVGKGIGFMAIAFVLIMTMFIGIGIILYPAFLIYQIYDAYKVAKGA
jgi:TM2 domain-containing membrane protein YozV